MYKFNYLALILIMTAIGPLVVASESSNYDFDEFSFGIESSSINNSHIVSYNHSRVFSESFFYTIDLTQKSSTRFNQLSNSKAEIGIGWHTGVSDVTDVYFELSYSKTWVHGLNNYDYDSFHLKSGSISDVSDRYQLVTETSFNKALNSRTYKSGLNSQRDVDFDIAGKFNINNSKVLAGLSTNKGFPYFGVNFK